jgi:hypothetical protein
MKIQIAVLMTISCLLLTVFQGCKEVADVNMEQIHRLQDSVSHDIPGVTAIDIKVAEQTQLKVIIGNPSFYNMDAATRQKAAVRLGEQAMLVFGADNGVKSGKLIITRESRNSAWDKDPADGEVMDMKLDSLKEHDEILLEFFSKMRR